VEERGGGMHEHGWGHKTLRRRSFSLAASSAYVQVVHGDFVVAPFRSISRSVTRVARRNGCPVALEGRIYSCAGRWTFRGQSGLPAGAERVARSVKLEQREASRARVSRSDGRTDGRTEGYAQQRRPVKRALGSRRHDRKRRPLEQL